MKKIISLLLLLAMVFSLCACGAKESPAAVEPEETPAPAEAEVSPEELAAQAAELEQDKSDLNTQIDQLGSVQSVLDIAEQELGLVNPDTVIFEPVN